MKKNSVSHNPILLHKDKKHSQLFLTTPFPKNSSMVTSSLAKEKTKLVQKSYSELNNLVLAQQFQSGNEAIWVMKLRSDGEYLATGGQEGVIRIWKTAAVGNEDSNIHT